MIPVSLVMDGHATNFTTAKLFGANINAPTLGNY